MRGPEHVSIAVVSTGGFLWLTSGQHSVSALGVAAVGVAGIGALVPDIDHPKAWISNRIPVTLIGLGSLALLGFALLYWSVRRGLAGPWAPVYSAAINYMQPQIGWAWLSLLIGLAIFVTSLIVSATMEHRGPTHSLIVGAAVTGLALGVTALMGQPVLGLWFGWGYLTHLLADALTPMGCPSLLWPWRVADSPTRMPWQPVRPTPPPSIPASPIPNGTTPAEATGGQTPEDGARECG